MNKFNFIYNKNQLWHVKSGYLTRQLYPGEKSFSNRDYAINLSHVYITYGGSKFRDALKELVVDVYGEDMIELYRHPERGYCGDFSRDQLTMMIIAFTIRGDIKFRNDLIRKVLKQKRISMKFKADKIWLRGILNNKPSIMRDLYNFFQVGVGFWITLQQFKSSGIKIVSTEEYRKRKETPHSKRADRISKNGAVFPIYALNKYCWQTYITPKTWIGKRLNKWLIKVSDPWNITHRMLLGDKVTKGEVDAVIPHYQDQTSAWHLNTNWGVDEIKEGLYTENLKDCDLIKFIWKNSSKRL